MAAEVVLTRQAHADLNEIADYLLSEAGPRTATAVTNRILARIETLSLFPRSNRERPELGAGRRLLVCRPYAVVYRVEDIEERTIVVVGRILHGARDLRAIFSEE